MKPLQFHEIFDTLTTIAVANDIREPGIGLWDIAINIDDYKFENLEKTLERYSLENIEILRRHAYNPTLKTWLKNFYEKKSQLECE